MFNSPSAIPPPQSVDEDVLHDFHPFFKVYKDGRVERYAFHNQPVRPPGFDPETGIETKDIVLDSDTGLTVRLFTPNLENLDHKVPLIIHIHGGGFCVGSALDAITHNFVASLLSQVQAVVISVEYRLAPEHPLPTAYEDSWEALKWVGSHAAGSGPEPVLNRSVDLDKVFLLGESAGANIAHNLVTRAGTEGLPGLKIAGMVAVHPFFVGDEEDRHYKFLCPTSSGCRDDPRLCPGADPGLARMVTGRVLVCLAEKDHLRGRGLEYYETLRKSGWVGSVELFESEGRDHCFHMFSKDEKAQELIKKFAEFVKRE
uniref:Alpha/beta hydrolase fold-3 domain-containing protein n=1 Tax=Kalanchoe fedtschenkoi TaxID=63787 RepID=A0A7N0T1Y4_KALFE